MKELGFVIEYEKEKGKRKKSKDLSHHTMIDRKFI